MPVYMVVFAIVIDISRFKEYTRTALPLLERAGGRRIAISTPLSLEGGQPWRGSAIYAWPSREQAVAFWNSPEYAKVKKLREGAAELYVSIIDGISDV